MRGATKLGVVEHQIGLHRHITVADFSGAEAVALWHHYLYDSNPDALHLLVRYNLEDTVNLEKVLKHCLNRIYTQFPFLGIEELNPYDGLDASALDISEIIDACKS